MKKKIQRIAWHYLPKKKLSYMVGKLSKHRLSKRLIPYYIKAYQIDLSAVKKPLNEFDNLLDFFIRELKPEMRPIDKREDVVTSPVDGTISQIGRIHEETIIQAKGLNYSLTELLGDDKENIDRFINGQFVTIYLSPSDYHRIHSPVEGKVIKLVYIPGELFPVNRQGVDLIPDVFVKNERVISYIKNDYGFYALVKVGATNVGSIKVVFDDNIPLKNKKGVHHQNYSNDVLLSKGEELGRFEFGSTVILLFQPQQVKWIIEPTAGTKVQMGQALARLT